MSRETLYPEGNALKAFIEKRKKYAGGWQIVFLVAIIIAVIALVTLLYTIINDSFGLTLVEPVNHPQELVIAAAKEMILDASNVTASDVSLEELPKDVLVSILRQNVSAGRFRALENEKPMAERNHDQVYDLVWEEVVQPTTVRAWRLAESLLNRVEIEQIAAEEYPEGQLVFRAWVSRDFISSSQSSKPDQAGIRTAILGSLWVVGITMLIAIPLGIGGGIYLEEYAAHIKNPTFRRINDVIQTNINNLAGVPSIIYGILGLAVFVRALEPITSGTALGMIEDPTTANGRTILSAGMTLALLILPIIIINAQEAIRAVPPSIREASFGLGATRWETIWNHVLPNAIPGILTGVILSLSRALGETAPLIVVGASTFITVDPSGPFSKFTVLPIQIFQWTARPQKEFQYIAAAAIVFLLILLLTLNATAIYLRNRYSRRMI